VINRVMEMAGADWAMEEFGHAELGHAARTKRIVAVARGAAECPGGRITQVFHVSSERERGFRAVESQHVDPAALGRAAHVACARRASRFPFVYVPVDGTSLNISDWSRCKGLGVVGAFWVGATGLQVMSAIALSPDGTPLGICGQTFWARRSKVPPEQQRKQRRRLEDTETRHMVNNMVSVTELFAAHAPETKPWFVWDRGGDAYHHLLAAKEHDVLITVRASSSRRLWTTKEAKRRKYLWDEVQRQPASTCLSVWLPATHKRSARHAVLEVRHLPVHLRLHDGRGRRARSAAFTAVHVRERGVVPRGQERVEWMLLTTYKVDDAEAAIAVVQGYAQRWAIEEFHRTWKSGACNVESTQLRSVDAILRWATILASVAMRIQRLTKLARAQPDLDATLELTRGELDAIIQSNAKARRTYKPGDTPTLVEAVHWLAELGGYTGKSSGGPPGATVITRGLDRIQLLAELLDRTRPK
jgi:hypothetical protein